MADNMYIDSEKLVAIANSLKNKSSNIMNQYQNDCQVALQMGSECITLSGLDTNELSNYMGTVYQQLTEKLNALADFLIKASSEYDALNQTLTNNFNGNLKNQILEILGSQKMVPLHPQIGANREPVIEVPRDMSIPKQTETE